MIIKRPVKITAGHHTINKAPLGHSHMSTMRQALIRGQTLVKHPAVIHGHHGR